MPLNSELHPNAAGKMRGRESEREQCVVWEGLSEGPELGSTIIKP